MGTVTDGELWWRAKGGDPDAFGTLFERHARRVYNFCFRGTADWGAAEDLTSEAFLVAWRKRDQVGFGRETESLLPWILGIALNLMRNHRRAKRRGTRAIARLPHSRATADFASDVVERIDDQERMKVVLAHLDRLPQSEQEILALCVWGGLSSADAADVLCVPVGTARSRLSRAKAHLAQLTGLSGHYYVESKPVSGGCHEPV